MILSVGKETLWKLLSDIPNKFYWIGISVVLKHFKRPTYFILLLVFLVIFHLCPRVKMWIIDVIIISLSKPSSEKDNFMWSMHDNKTHIKYSSLMAYKLSTNLFSDISESPSVQYNSNRSKSSWDSHGRCSSKHILCAGLRKNTEHSAYIIL